ncbi:MAG: hypothetical protein U0169_16015 [Polyangiaceae bacterium]
MSLRSRSGRSIVLAVVVTSLVGVHCGPADAPSAGHASFSFAGADVERIDDASGGSDGASGGGDVVVTGSETRTMIDAPSDTTPVDGTPVDTIPGATLPGETVDMTPVDLAPEPEDAPVVPEPPKPVVPKVTFDVHYACSPVASFDVSFEPKDDGSRGTCTVRVRSRGEASGYGAATPEILACLAAGCANRFPAVDRIVGTYDTSKDDCTVGRVESSQLAAPGAWDAKWKIMDDERARAKSKIGDVVTETCATDGVRDDLKGCEGIPTTVVASTACHGVTMAAGGTTTVGENKSYVRRSGLGGLVDIEILTSADFVCSWIQSCASTIGGRSVTGGAVAGGNGNRKKVCGTAPSADACAGLDKVAAVKNLADSARVLLFRRKWTAPYPAADSIGKALVETAYDSAKDTFDKDCAAFAAKVITPAVEANLCDGALAKAVASQKVTSASYCCERDVPGDADGGVTME